MGLGILTGRHPVCNECLFQLDLMCIFLLYARCSTSNHCDVYVQKSYYYKISKSEGISAIAFFVSETSFILDISSSMTV